MIGLSRREASAPSILPKPRPPLPEGIARIYELHYRQNRTGGTPAAAVAQRMESWLHRQVASDVVRDRAPRSTLEIGAGTLNQLPFEPHVGPYDIVEPFTALYDGRPLLSRVRHIFADIRGVSLEARYDRITSVATFEHICNLAEVVARAAALLAPEGVLRASIPSEGTILWGLAWRLTTGIEFRLRHRQDYGALMRHEHVNSAREIEDILRYFFGRVRVRTLGPARRLSLYQFFACSEPDLARAGEFLGKLPGAGG